MIADLLEEDLYVENTDSGRAGMVSFNYVSQPVDLLEYHKNRLQLRSLSLHADILNERHTEGELAKIVPMQQFIDADCFLFLRAELQEAELSKRINWLAWSTLYIKQPPRYLHEAVRVRYAQQLLRPLGVENIDTLRFRIAERTPKLGQLFKTIFHFAPLGNFDPQTIGSR